MKWWITIILAGLTGILIGYQIISNTTARTTSAFQKWQNEKPCELFFEFGGQVYSDSGIKGQSAVCLDSGLAPPSGLCNVYSFSESNERSFEKMMEVYGCDVYVFNQSNAPISNHSNGAEMKTHFPHIHFFQFGLATLQLQHNITKG